ncbi:hypothetical protein [Streptomyces sp. XY66]|uniref:hypothetical protein n=1 Tax=Streptomyces sp. XY66 TaxID=1415563 RepID=UPI00131C27DA|nr:hypothetical protein [Streptomyces sp. XY66]
MLCHRSPVPAVTAVPAVTTVPAVTAVTAVPATVLAWLVLRRRLDGRTCRFRLRLRRDR